MIGQYRPASHVRSGWHIRIEEPPDSGEYVWTEVVAIADTTNYVTGQRGRRFFTAASQSAACGRSDDVMCRNVAEVRDAAKGATS